MLIRNYPDFSLLYNKEQVQKIQLKLNICYLKSYIRLVFKTSKMYEYFFKVFLTSCKSYYLRDPYVEPTYEIFQIVRWVSSRCLSNVRIVKQWHVLNRFPSTLYGQELLFDRYSIYQEPCTQFLEVGTVNLTTQL